MELKKRLYELRANVLKPSSKLNLVEWAEENRILPATSSTPGKWKTSFIEPARGPMLALTEKGVKKITIMGPTQMLKTEFINNVIGYTIHQDPAPLILAMPNEKLLNDYSQERLDPMLENCPCFKDLVKDKSERDGGNTRFKKTFPGGQITLVSAASPTDVSSRPARIVFMDEVDKYTTAGKEGDPIKLLEERITTYWNSLSIAVCSPTIEGTSKIERRFLDSDQRYFHAKCPHCNEYEKMKWSQVKWDDGNPLTARYVCSSCHKDWTEIERIGAVKNGIYIAEKPFNGHAGFHVNALASPWETIPALVQKFLSAKDDPEQLKTFINTKLAETWKVKVEAPEWERLFERKETYSPGIVPSDDVKFLTMGVDVQADRLEAQIVGWTRNKQSYIIDHLIIPGATHTNEPWKKLEEIIDKPFPVLNKNRNISISMTCIDSGFNSQYVYDFVGKYSQLRVRAIKGSDNLFTIYRMGNDLTYNLNGTKRSFGHKLWMVGSSFLKDILYKNLKIAKTTPTPNNYVHIPDLGEDFFKGIVGEVLTLEKGKWVWKKVVERNEALDAYNYARAGASMFGLDRFTDYDWSLLEGEEVQEIKKEQVNIKSNKPQNRLGGNKSGSIYDRIKERQKKRGRF